jgi:hypothetical protein
VASRDEGKGAQNNDEDDDEQNEYSNSSWLRQFEFSEVSGSFLHRSPLLGAVYIKYPGTRSE